VFEGKNAGEADISAVLSQIHCSQPLSMDFLWLGELDTIWVLAFDATGWAVSIIYTV
jgi:hypothetical protein